MKNILIRAISGAFYVSVIIISILYSQWAFLTLMFIFGLLSIKELNHLLPGSNPSIYKIPVYSIHLLAFALVLANDLGYVFEVTRSIFLLIIPLILVLGLYQKGNDWRIMLGNSLTCLVYITAPLILLHSINSLPSSVEFPLFSFGLFCMIWANDTFAFLVGMTIGKHKLFERISPKKTWEGLIGGLAACLLLAYGFFQWFEGLSLVQWMFFAVLVSLAAVFGDFIESNFKRQSGAKDSGNLIPGHGGILDRIDSLLFSAPIIFVFLQIIS